MYNPYEVLRGILKAFSVAQYVLQYSLIQSAGKETIDLGLRELQITQEPFTCIAHHCCHIN